MAKFLSQSSPTDKKCLLEIVTRKIFRLTQDLQELDILDYNISKNAKRVTLSVGFKENIQNHQKFDLSSMFTFGNDNIGTEVYNGCHIRNGNHTPHAECQFSKDQDRDFEYMKENTPVCKLVQGSSTLCSSKNSSTRFYICSFTEGEDSNSVLYPVLHILTIFPTSVTMILTDRQCKLLSGRVSSQ